MTHITLVLPFALPPPELAPDLIRALQAPSLAQLISRASRKAPVAASDYRTLPYESWLARTLGLSSTGQPAFAASAMRAAGHEASEGSWFLVHPAHFEIARSHLLLHDLRGLRLSDAHARALFAAAEPYFAEQGRTLVYGDALTWFLRADDWAGLNTASPDAATGLNMADFLPVGEAAARFRRLQNEVQMLWHSHPVNGEREAQGLASINGLWLWGVSTAATTQYTTPLATTGAPPWIAALANRPAAAVSALLTSGPESVLVCAETIAPALATDWSGWLAAMQHLEQTVLAPALVALNDGQARQVKLLISHRTQQVELVATRLSQRAFWRSPSLNALLSAPSS